MYVECIMAVFDGFYSMKLIYLANYAKISDFQLFPKHLHTKWLKITFSYFPACFTTQRMLNFTVELYFTIKTIS